EYWRTSKGKQDTLNRIFAEPLEYEPGTKMVYSDLGIILGRNHRTPHRSHARRPRAPVHLQPPRHDRFDVPAAQETLAAHCANGGGHTVPPPLVARRSA